MHLLPAAARRRAATGLPAAVPDDAGWPRSGHKGRIIGQEFAACRLQLEASQQHGPYDFDLLVSEAHPDAAMLAAAESDQRKLGAAVFLATRSETVGIVPFRVAEDVRQAMRYSGYNHGEFPAG